MWLLTGHGPFGEYIDRFGFRLRGPPRDTFTGSDHVLNVCPVLAERRAEMKSRLADIVEKDKR